MCSLTFNGNNFSSYVILILYHCYYLCSLLDSIVTVSTVSMIYREPTVQSHTKCTDPVAAMDFIREEKNNFKAKV